MLISMGLMVAYIGRVFGEKRGGFLEVGAPAPDIRGLDQSGQTVTLKRFRGVPVVVYFYPKDDTPGCTQEACAFRDAYAEFEQKKVIVFGISRDSATSHEKFRKKYRLPFVLVPDEDGKVARAYGVSSVLGMSERVTFLVDKHGKIARVWSKVDPVVHAQEVLKSISAWSVD